MYIPLSECGRLSGPLIPHNSQARTTAWKRSSHLMPVSSLNRHEGQGAAKLCCTCDAALRSRHPRSKAKVSTWKSSVRLSRRQAVSTGLAAGSTAALRRGRPASSRSAEETLVLCAGRFQKAGAGPSAMMGHTFLRGCGACTASESSRSTRGVCVSFRELVAPEAPTGGARTFFLSRRASVPPEDDRQFRIRGIPCCESARRRCQ